MIQITQQNEAKQNKAKSVVHSKTFEKSENLDRVVNTQKENNFEFDPK